MKIQSYIRYSINILKSFNYKKLQKYIFQVLTYMINYNIVIIHPSTILHRLDDKVCSVYLKFKELSR